MRLLLCLPLLILPALVVAVCLAQPGRTIRRVIADVDPGIDDVEALVFLVDADQRGLLKLEAIVVTEGNTVYEYGVRNVFLLLEVLNRLDIPVYLGGKHPILKHDEHMGGFFGSDGLGDLTWNQSVPVDLLQEQRAFEAVRDLVKRHPGQITYMSMAPMTTLGMTIWMYPEVAEGLQQVYAMGGLIYHGEGEFNVAFDPEAVDIVLRSLKGNMLLVTWQAGSTNSPRTDWYNNVTDVSNPAWRFMTRVQDALNVRLFSEDPPVTKWEHCDPIVPAVFLNPELITESFSSPLKIEVGRVKSRGVMTNATLPYITVHAVEDIDYDAFLADYVATFKGVCDKTERPCQDVN